jgi:transcription antitermination factor NusG
MIMSSISEHRNTETAHFLATFGEPHWYVAYTRANHEKHVAAHLDSRGVEHFLPLYCSTRRWKDRRVQLELPLFPGYVFVRLALFDRLRVIEIPSVVRLVGFGGGLATALPDDQVEALRSGLNGELKALPHPFLSVGRRVRIKSGPLAGLEGILLRQKGRHRVVVSIEMIQRSISVDADATDVEPKLSFGPIGLLPLNSPRDNQ